MEALRKEIKFSRNKYLENYQKVFKSAERKQIKSVRKYLLGEYNRCIDFFIKTNTVPYEAVFRTDDLVDIYREMYAEIGVKMAENYKKTFDKVSKMRKSEPERNSRYRFLYQDYDTFNIEFWQTMGRAGEIYAGELVTLVSGAKKDHVKKTIKELLNDPFYQQIGAAEQARIFRNYLGKKFEEYAKYESERLVRTESTTAANYAIGIQAQQMFMKEDMIKEWISGQDGRERLSHREANGQQVPFESYFEIGITKRINGREAIFGTERIFYPGDPEASPSNRINCRCAHAPLPKEDLGQVRKPAPVDPKVREAVIAERERQSAIRTQQEEREKLVREAESKRLETIRREYEKYEDATGTMIFKGMGDPAKELFEFTPGLRNIVFESGRKGARYSLKKKTIYMNTRFNWKEASKYTLAHEVGHHVHEYHKIFNVRDGYQERMNPIFKGFYKDLERFLSGKGNTPGENRELRNLKNIFVQYYNEDGTDDEEKFTQWQMNVMKNYQFQETDLSYNEFAYYFSGIADILAAASKSTIGSGHDPQYFSQYERFVESHGVDADNIRHSEVFANTFMMNEWNQDKDVRKLLDYFRIEFPILMKKIDDYNEKMLEYLRIRLGHQIAEETND